VGTRKCRDAIGEIRRTHEDTGATSKQVADNSASKQVKLTSQQETMQAALSGAAAAADVLATSPTAGTSRVAGVAAAGATPHTTKLPPHHLSTLNHQASYTSHHQSNPTPPIYPYTSTDVTGTLPDVMVHGPTYTSRGLSSANCASRAAYCLELRMCDCVVVCVCTCVLVSSLCGLVYLRSFVPALALAECRRPNLQHYIAIKWLHCNQVSSSKHATSQHA
jgi:hypothetical protein